MKCPNCGNETYEMLDYAIARCTNCYSLWDPYIYPGFPTPDVGPGGIWDTSEPDDEDMRDDEEEEGEEEFDEFDPDGEEEEADFDEDWGEADEEPDYDEEWEEEDEYEQEEDD
jgi:hypothetical protein